MMRDLFGNLVQEKNQCEISANQGMLVVKTPYRPELVNKIKGLPYTDRKWDPAQKAWMVAPAHGQWLVKLIEECFGETISLPATKVQTKPEIKLLEIHYIGRCKDRNGENSAFGMLPDGTWGVILPEKSLREWFDAGDVLPGEQATLYAVLGVSRSSQDEQIKTAYRRMAKTWHPDLNRGDPDAAEQFRRVQQAWEILSSPKMRARYDAGLALEATLQRNTEYSTDNPGGYRAPLRCGWIMAEGVYQLGRFVVSKILEWQDIVNQTGQILVVSWPAGGDKPVKVWA